MIYVNYVYCEYFYLFGICFLSSIILTIVSSSAICDNGCNFYLALLSSSATVTVGNYAMTSALYNLNGKMNYYILSIDSIISIIVIFYLTLKLSEKKEVHTTEKVTITEMKNLREFEESKVEETDESQQLDDQSYKLFQFFLSCYSFYIGMILTNWEWDVIEYTSFIARLVQTGFLFLFYIWTLIAPVLLQDREFS